MSEALKMVKLSRNGFNLLDFVVKFYSHDLETINL